MTTDTPFPYDSGKQMAYEVLRDREVAPPEEIQERIENYPGDLWSDFFGPLMDEIENAIFDRGE